MSTLYSNHSNNHATKLDQVSTFEIKISIDLLLNLHSQQVLMLLFADILAQTVRHIQNHQISLVQNFYISESVLLTLKKSG